MGLAMLALSVSTLSTGLPEMGSRVRPLLLTAPDLGALKKRFPVRELSVASMIAVKRPMTMGSEKKTSRSAAASGPLKHVFSTHLRAHGRGGVGGEGIARGDRAGVAAALQLVVPTARLEVVQEAHERVDGRKEPRQRDLGDQLRKRGAWQSGAAGGRAGWGCRVLR
jgi:hypothetical protein